MICIEKVLTQPVPSDIYTIGAPEDVLFFDIETTGLSARSAGLYLIGVLTYTDKNWTLLQYFCEDVADEPAVLQAFFELLRTKKILISYNGDGFDIPFLRHMVEQYGLRAPRPHHSTALHDRADCPATDGSAIADAPPLYSFDTVESFDLFKKFRPLKHLLGLPDLKLKSCERFLGIDREDRFTGGELIEVYFEWQKTKAPALLDTLLLHNAEDIANLPNLLPLLRYRSLPHSDFQLRAHERDECTIHLHYLSALTLPKPMDLRGDFWALHAEGNAVELYVQLFEGERKLFFADFEHYYYLPAEDQVIHQSLAEFVDRSARKKACARNCYQRVSGCFLPECSEVYTPTLRAEYRDKLRYAQYSDTLFDDEAKAVTYLKSFLEAYGV